MPLTEEQRELRLRGIGASEIGALLGESKWANPRTIWAEKTGKAESAFHFSTAKAQEAAWWGTEFEPIILKRLSMLRDGAEIFTPNETWTHSKYPHVLASLDGWYLSAPLTAVVTDAKTAGETAREDYGTEGTVDMPRPHYLQLQQQMTVAESVQFGVGEPIRAERAELPVLFLGQSMGVYETPHDREVSELLCEIIEDFWAEYVEKDIRPPEFLCEGSGPLSSEAVRTVLSVRNNVMLDPKTLGREAVDIVTYTAHELRDAYREKKAAESRFKEFRAEMESIIGDYGGVVTALGNITFRQTRGSTTWDTDRLILLCRELGVSEEDLQRCKEVSDGCRQFRVPRNW